MNNEECPLGYLCGTLQDESRKCVKMFSIETGEYADEDELCKSGKKTYNDICVDMISANQGKECTKDEDCPCEYDIKSEQEQGVAECKCNLEGKKYCEYGSTSEQWKQFVNVFGAEVDKVQIHSTQRD